MCTYVRTNRAGTDRTHQCCPWTSHHLPNCLRLLQQWCHSLSAEHAGESLGVYGGHIRPIHSVAVLLNSQGWVTGGEDRFLKVGNQNSVCQTIYLPNLKCASSVQKVTTLASGDIIASMGTHNGEFRIFSKDASAMNERDSSAGIDLCQEEELGRCSMCEENNHGGKKARVPHFAFKALLKPRSEDPRGQRAL